MITIPVITERCAGIDVGKRGLAVAVALGPADKEAEIKTRESGTTVPALQELKGWLLEQGCTSVAMESTGSYWIPVKNILEEGLKITLVCARQHRPKKGEKTDFRDAMDLAIHQRHGLLRGSYLPERRIVELRDLTRRRKKLMGVIGAEKNRIQKVLECANVKMGSVMRDVFGVSGQEILQALLEHKELEAAELAGMAKRRLREKIPQLTEALEAHQMNDHHRWLIRQSVAHAQFVDEQVEELEKRIEEYLKPYQKQIELLMTIPGVGYIAAVNILAETGGDMNQFADAHHISSWAGVCSGNNRSAGKRKNSHIKKANQFLLAVLVESAWGAARKKDSIFQRRFYRWMKRMGEKKTNIALAHSLLRVVWSVLKHEQPYVEPDATVLKALEREKQVRHHARQLHQLGADEKMIETMVTNLLEAPLPASPAHDGAALKPKTYSARRPAVARGALGLRIRNKERKEYSVVKEQPGAPPRATTPTRSRRSTPKAKNTRGQSPTPEG